MVFINDWRNLNEALRSNDLIAHIHHRKDEDIYQKKAQRTTIVLKGSLPTMDLLTFVGRDGQRWVNKESWAKSFKQVEQKRLLLERSAKK